MRRATPNITKTHVANIRLTADAAARLDALAARYPLTKHAIARIALAMGLDAIDRDPKWFEKAGKAK